MKKFIYISLLTVYSLLSVGFTLATHFCKGKVSNVSVFHNLNEDKQSCSCESGCCSKCDTECCKDELKTIKIEDFHTSEKSFETKRINSIEYILTDSFQIGFELLYEFQFVSKSPPIFKELPAFILNNSLLI